MSNTITIITPNLNGGRFLEECILSIKQQNYEGARHIVIDGGSTDNSLEILKKHKIEYEIKPELNNYEAIHYGLSTYRSDIQAWLNADDIYHPGALKAVMKVFNNKSQVKWITGLPSITDESGKIIPLANSPFPLHSKYSFLFRQNFFIQQESTFWRQELYNQVEGFDNNIQYANDYKLWQDFFKQSKLYVLPQILASFRQHSSNQISIKFKPQYESEVESIALSRKKELGVFKWTVLKLFMNLDYFIIHIPVIRKWYAHSSFRIKFLAFAEPILVPNLI